MRKQRDLIVVASPSRKAVFSGLVITTAHQLF